MSRSGGSVPFPAREVSYPGIGSRAKVLSLGLALICSLLMLVSCTTEGAELSVRLTDAVSGGWVWGARLEIQDRVAESYLQSDRGALPISLTGLRRGPASLTVTAPGYRQEVIPVTLRRGAAQRLEVALQGESIPGLADFTIRRDDPGPYIQGALVPLTKAGSPIRFHPAVELWIGFTISQELSDGVPAAAPVQQGAARGLIVDSGRLGWVWDSAIDASYRYQLTPYNPQAGSLLPGSLHVVDILIVPTGSDQELPTRIEAAWEQGGASAVIALLESIAEDESTSAATSAPAAAAAPTPQTPRYTILTYWNVGEQGIIARQT